MINFGIVGSMGRMGQAIARLSLQDTGYTLKKTFEHPLLSNISHIFTLILIKDSSIIKTNKKIAASNVLWVQKLLPYPNVY